MKCRTHNSTFAIGGVSCSADSLVVAESFVLRINTSGKNPAHRKSAKRYLILDTRYWISYFSAMSPERDFALASGYLRQTSW